MLGAYCIYAIWLGGRPDWVSILTTATFISGFVPGQEYSLVWAGWTIGVEMPFYLLLPLMAISVWTLTHAVWLSVALLIVSIVARLALAPAASTMAWTSLASNIGVFGLGVLTYHIARVWHPTPAQVRIFAITACTWLSFLMLRLIGDVILPGNIEVLFWSVPLGMLCLWQAIDPSHIAQGRVAQWLGGVSYSLYLTHPLVIWLLHRLGVYHTIDASLARGIGSWTYLV